VDRAAALADVLCVGSGHAACAVRLDQLRRDRLYHKSPSAVPWKWENVLAAIGAEQQPRRLTKWIGRAHRGLSDRADIS
jgi:hypothetical protein